MDTMKPSLHFGWAVLSRHRAACYGFCAIWIVLFHGASNFGCDFSFGMAWLQFVNVILSFGNFGVDIFLVLSGISCYYSWSRSHEAGSFFSKRLRRIVPPVMIICGTFWILWALTGVISWPRALYLATLVLPIFSEGGNGIWYVDAILLLYAFYPYIHSAIYGNKGGGMLPERNLLARLVALLFALLVGFWMLHKYNPSLFWNLEIMCARIPAFCIGAYLGHLVKEAREFSRGFVTLLLICLVCYACYALLLFRDLSGEVWWWRLTMVPGGVLGALFICCLAEAFSRIRAAHLLSAPFVTTGEFSLELYVAHIMCFWPGGLLPSIDGSALRALGIGLLSWLIAYVVNRALYVWRGGGLVAYAHDRCLSIEKSAS